MSFNATMELERLQQRLKQLQSDQEKELFNIGGLPEKKFLPNPLSFSIKTKMKDDKTLGKYLQLDCFILPDSSPNSTLRRGTTARPWPFALVAHFNDKSADIGNIESHGSLWRLKKFESANSTSNTVVFQTSVFSVFDFILSESVDYNRLTCSGHWRENILFNRQFGAG